MKKTLTLLSLLLLCLLTLVACKAETTPCEEHTFGEWEVTKEATCTAIGQKTRVCSVCEYEEKTDVAKIDHKYSNSIINPTATEEGYTLRTCTLCAIETKTAYRAAMGSIGLTYAPALLDDGGSHIVTGIGTCTDEIIYIPYENGGQNVSGIGEGAFKDCTNIKKVILLEPSAEYLAYTAVTAFNVKLNNIGEEAFAGCTSLESVKLGSSIEKIHASAFKGCTALNELEFGNVLTTIGDSAFENCTSLEAFPHLRKLERVGTAAFKNCTLLKEFFVCKSVTFVGAQALAGCTELRSLQLEETENWQYALSEDATQWTDVNPNDLKNVAIAATQYLENYYQVCFKKKAG